MFENGNDKEILEERLGDLIRKKEIPFVEFIKEECDRRGIRLAFDMNDIYDGKKTLIYTEFFGGMGGVSLRPTHAIHKYKTYTDAIIEAKNKIDFSELVETVGDKYIMSDCSVTYKKIILIPGTNVLTIETDPDKIRKAISCGAKIKPHPLTNDGTLKLLAEWFGKDNILDKDLSGFELMKGADVIYGTKQSELVLYALLLGKEVNYIERDRITAKGCYRSLIKFIELYGNQKETLNKLLNSWKTGVFFPNSDKEDIIKYLDYIGGIIGGRKN